MKKRSVVALLLSFVMMLSVFATACSSSPKTIEEYIKNDKEAADQLKKVADTAGLAVDFSGNDVVYTYDISTIDGVTEEVGKSDMMKEQLAAALDKQGETFVGLCKQLEEESKIEGVKIIINYTFGDESIVNKAFNSVGSAD